MSSKHVAAGIVALLVVGLVQLTFWVQSKRNNLQKDAAKQEQAEKAAAKKLESERQSVAQLQKSSQSLIAFLETWQTHFDLVNTAQSAEVNFTMRIKEDNLTNLAQRFEPVHQKGNHVIPTIMRAYVTFEDDYARLLNWLGRTEQQMPTVRMRSVRLTKGTRANDLRMEVVMEQPLLQK